jgi:hypothetical protein
MGQIVPETSVTLLNFAGAPVGVPITVATLAISTVYL